MRSDRMASSKQAQWNEVVKMAKATYEKAIPDSHWGMFEEMYGADSGTYLLLTSHKSLGEIDKGLMDDEKFSDAMGEEGMKKFDALYAECCEAAQQQLFAFSPSQSYVQDEWIKANPDFWKPRPRRHSQSHANGQETESVNSRESRTTRQEKGASSHELAPFVFLRFHRSTIAPQLLTIDSAIRGPESRIPRIAPMTTAGWNY